MYAVLIEDIEKARAANYSVHFKTVSLWLMLSIYLFMTYNLLAFYFRHLDHI